jgi:xanthine dehydrogenase small subunit
LLGRADGDGVAYQPVTSCIQFLWQLDGAHVLTIEGLKYDGRLNPVQEAMARCHGTQCGFCTPGFVVAMCHAMDGKRKIDADGMCASLVGNLCRCTGYEPIIRAGLDVDPATIRTIGEMYPPFALVNAMRDAARDEVLIEAGAKTFFKPTSVRGAVEFKASNPTCVPVAGGTDVGVQINKLMRDPDVVMYLGAIDELRTIETGGDTLVVGGLVTLAEMERHTQDCCPELHAMFKRHGSPLIRNAGTLAGNIANGSPIGDALPALYVLNALVELAGGGGNRRVNINDFFTGYRKSVMAADEIIVRVHVPLPRAGDVFKLYKVSKRWDLDISSFMAAVWARLSNENTIDEIRIAYGGVGPNIIRARRTEQFLTDKRLTSDVMGKAGEIARSEVTPISDVRGSAQFRFQLSENILQRFCAEVGCEVTSGLYGNGDGNGEAC